MGRVAAGNLTERVGLRAATAGSDGRGGLLPGAVTTPVVVHAQARTLSGSEVTRLGQTLGTEVVEFTLRYRPSLTTGTLVTWKGKSYGARQVVHDEAKKEFTVLTCVNNGRG